MPSLTGSRYGSGLLAAIEDSPVHEPQDRAISKTLSIFLTASTIAESTDSLASHPVCGLACLVAQEPSPTAGAG